MLLALARGVYFYCYFFFFSLSMNSSTALRINIETDSSLSCAASFRSSSTCSGRNRTAVKSFFTYTSYNTVDLSVKAFLLVP